MKKIKFEIEVPDLRDLRNVITQTYDVLTSKLNAIGNVHYIYFPVILQDAKVNVFYIDTETAPSILP